MPRLILVLIALFALALPTHAGPETADEVRARRALRQLEENDRNKAREDLARTYEELPEVDPALIEDYTEMLDIIADPSMEGRVPGSRGIEDAAQYIESHLKALGLTPAFTLIETPNDKTDNEDQTDSTDETQDPTPFTSFRQQLQMGSQTAATTERLSFGDTTFEPGPDFSPLAYSGSATVHAPLAFVGYAIVSGPNNYLGFETSESIEGKIALALNYEPMNDDGSPLWREEKWSHNARLTYKVAALERRGAAAVIIVSPPNAQDDRVRLLETSNPPPPHPHAWANKPDPSSISP